MNSTMKVYKLTLKSRYNPLDTVTRRVRAYSKKEARSQILVHEIMGTDEYRVVKCEEAPA